MSETQRHRQSKRESHFDSNGCPIKNPGRRTRVFLIKNQPARPKNYFFVRRRIRAIPLRQRREVKAGSGTAAGSEVNKAKVNAGPEILGPELSTRAVPRDTNPEPPTADGCANDVGLYQDRLGEPVVTPTQ